MPIVYMNDKEAENLLVTIELCMIENPDSATTENIAKLPDRIRLCLELQSNRKAEKNKKENRLTEVKRNSEN